MTTFDELSQKDPGIVWTFFDNPQKAMDLARASEKREPLQLDAPFSGNFLIIRVWIRRRSDDRYVTEIEMRQMEPFR